jgi:hypothetical protein
VKTAAVQRIMRTYMFLSAITVVVGIAVYWMLGGLFDPKENAGHWSFVCFLFLISIFDFYWLRQYYFDFDSWKISNAVPTK